MKKIYRVYKITSPQFTQCYIGCTETPLNVRLSSHISLLNSNTHTCKPLQGYYNNGLTNLNIESIYEFSTKSEMQNLESYLIKTTDNCMNDYSDIVHHRKVDEVKEVYTVRIKPTDRNKLVDRFGSIGKAVDVLTTQIDDLTYNYIIKHHSSLATFVKRQVEVEQQLKQLTK